ncbi:diguanylate cyclase, partial [Pseudomonas syringae]
EHTLERQIPAASMSGEPFRRLICDLAHFQPANDRHGHPAGGCVITRVAALLPRRLRLLDVPAPRAAGDCPLRPTHCTLHPPAAPPQRTLPYLHTIIPRHRLLGRAPPVAAAVAAGG